MEAVESVICEHPPAEGEYTRDADRGRDTGIVPHLLTACHVGSREVGAREPLGVSWLFGRDTSLFPAENQRRAKPVRAYELREDFKVSSINRGSKVFYIFQFCSSSCLCNKQ